MKNHYEDYFSIDDLEEEYQKLEIEFMQSNDSVRQSFLHKELCLIEDAIDSKTVANEFFN